MSPFANRLFNVGFVLSLISAVAFLGLGAWAAQFRLIDDLVNHLTDGGIPLCNRELFGHREGVDFRISLTDALPIGGIMDDTTYRRIKKDDWWGRPNYPVKLPEIDLSLWPPFSISLAVPVLWFVRRRRLSNLVGFPIVAVRRAT